jgi:hypothetical protein
METNIYYCLPPAGGRIRSQGNYCLPPAGVLHSQKEGVEVLVDIRGVHRFSSLMKQNKKAKICFVIYIAGFFIFYFFVMK